MTGRGLSRLIENQQTTGRDAGANDRQFPSKLAVLPTQAGIAANWPRFRGPQGAGIAAFGDIPQKWNGATGESVLRKTAVELPGMSSPIIWNRRVFIAGATAQRREVYCLDAENGNLLWTRRVAHQASDVEVAVETATGFAASTPATDGQRVYAIFANGDLVAFDFEGNELWSHAFGKLDNPYGHASSLATYRERVIVQLDQGLGSDNKSRLMAMDGATGRLVWEVQRPVPASWATPVVIQFENPPRIITAVAYSMDSKRWVARHL